MSGKRNAFTSMWFNSFETNFSFKRANQTKHIKKLTYLSFDGRADFTLMPKNQVKREDHLTFVDEKGNYINHFSPSNKKAKTILNDVLQVIGDTDSFETLERVATDGENTNSGYKVCKGQNISKDAYVS